MKFWIYAQVLQFNLKLKHDNTNEVTSEMGLLYRLNSKRKRKNQYKNA
jgi:hypothetical protein